MLIDTHCHIHDDEFFSLEQRQEMYQRALDENIQMMFCIGTDVKSSRAALEMARTHEACRAFVGMHPHDAKDGCDEIGRLLRAHRAEITGIGEIGLDYHYDNSPRDVQITTLEQQLQWAVDYQLPVSFHVRDAFDDFWPIFDNFSGIRGILHSFTDTMAHAERGMQAGLYIGVNGISTFTKDAAQQEMFAQLPLNKIVLETDAPFLTPKPFRGTINEPSFVRRVAEHMASIRSMPLDAVSAITTDNAMTLLK